MEADEATPKKRTNGELCAEITSEHRTGRAAAQVAGREEFSNLTSPRYSSSTDVDCQPVVQANMEQDERERE